MSDAPLLLVVDDEPGVLAVVKRFALGAGFDVITQCQPGLCIRHGSARPLSSAKPPYAGRLCRLQPLRQCSCGQSPYVLCSHVLRSPFSCTVSTAHLIGCSILDVCGADTLREFMFGPSCRVECARVRK